ncbi:MAG TPA: MauE/DoxX family redox-associated membrane protein [Actinomycetota bacterium]|jgi:uncharacterized membrane protein YphA (DoxX/SURF4 family)
MPETLLRVAAALLAVTFAWAALAKIVRWPRWREALTAYDLPGPIARLAAPGVPLLEGAAAGLVVVGETHAGGALTLVLLSSFSGALVHAHARLGRRLPCGCFGRATARDYPVMLARNAALAAVAGSLLLAARDVSFLRSLDLPSGGELLPAAFVVAGVAIAGWLAWHATVLFERGGPR